MFTTQRPVKFRKFPLCLFIALAGSAILLTADNAPAQTTSNWTNPAGGSFDTAGNWSAGVPGVADTAVFDLSAGSPYTVTFSSDVTNELLFVRNDDVLFDLGGFTYDVSIFQNVIAGVSRIGQDDGDFGTLRITNGTLSNAQGIIGDLSGSTGVVTVTGAGSQWISSSGLFAGRRGNGTLNIADGGVVTTTSVNTSVANLSNTGIPDSTGAVTVTGAGSRWNNSGFLTVGSNGIGTLDVDAGGVVTSGGGTIGRTSTGVVTITDVGSQWINSGDLSVGRDSGGDGTLDIAGGGVVTGVMGNIGLNPGSTGAVTVTGTDSQWNNSGGLFVGNEGDGTLDAAAGGVATNAGLAYIGFDAGSTGAVTVTGTGSQWSSSMGLRVGGGRLASGVVSGSGDGTLTVAAGGVVTSGDVAGGVDGGGGIVGAFSGSTGVATVTGAGSQWNNNSGRFVIGDLGGNGTLNIADGGVVAQTGDSFIGFRIGSTGAVTVAGAGSQWNNSINLEVGRIGTGTVTQEAGAVTAISVLLGSAGGVGIYNLQGGTLTAETVRVFSGNDEFNFTGGTLRTSNFVGNLTNAGGTFAPGMSPAVTIVTGGYTQSATSTLEIELGGLLSGEFDQVVTGNVTLDGNLVVDLLPGFTPSLGDEFEILNIAGTLTGQFLGLGEGAMLAATGGQDFQISYLGGDGNNVVLTAVPEPSSLGLLAVGLMGLCRANRQRHSKTQ